MWTAAQVIEILDKIAPIVASLEKMGLKLEGTISVPDILALLRR